MYNAMPNYTLLIFLGESNIINISYGNLDVIICSANFLSETTLVYNFLTEKLKVFSAVIPFSILVRWGVNLDQQIISVWSKNIDESDVPK